MEWLSGELAEASNENDDLAIDLLISKIGSTSTDKSTKIKVTRTRFQPSGKPQCRRQLLSLALNVKIGLL